MLADELHRCHSFRWIPGIGVSWLQIDRMRRGVLANVTDDAPPALVVTVVPRIKVAEMLAITERR